MNSFAVNDTKLIHSSHPAIILIDAAMSEEEGPKEGQSRGIISLDLHFLKIDDVVELTIALYDIPRVKLDSKSKKAMKKGVEAVKGNLELIVKDLKPFYNMPRYEQAFKIAFRKACGDLAMMQLEKFKEQVTQCGIVYHMINTLRENQEWKRHFPGPADKKLDALEDIADRWAFHDEVATNNLTPFHREVTEGIEEIFKRLEKQPIKDSLADLDMNSLNLRTELWLCY